MVTVPKPTAVTSPVLVMVATLASEEDHRTWLVIATAFFPALGVNALYVVNCSVFPTATEPAAGTKINVPAPDCELPAGIAIALVMIRIVTIPAMRWRKQRNLFRVAECKKLS
jgi:hypothetical protein